MTTTSIISASTPGAPTTTTSGDTVSTSSSSKAYGKIIITLDNVLISKEKIIPSPSSLDGLDAESEMDLRIIGCELIQTSGILLKLPQTAMATGQVLFQRFYYSKSFVRQPMETTAMACVYLASKIEEAPRRIRDVINVFHHIKQVRSKKIIQPLILDPSYIRLKSDVTLAERRVLKELGFCVHVKHPHKLIVIYLQQLGYDKNSRFVQLSWNYMNDALRSDVFVRFTPESIACACIFLTARVLKIPLPSVPAWYLIFDVTEEDILEICSSILLLYERPKVNIEVLEKKVDSLAKEYQESRNKSKTGQSASSSPAGGTTVQSTNPSSRPTSPSAAATRTTTSSTTTSTSTKESEASHVSRPKESVEPARRSRLAEDNYIDSYSSGRKSRRDQSPISKKPRKSPSPITYNDSPPRHKHKKRKKSRYSSSEASRSRSRSRSRHRRDRKKAHRHERSRSPYSESRKHQHHHSSSSSSSKKTHHYSSNRH